jgi:hypothetical protein
MATVPGLAQGLTLARRASFFSAVPLLAALAAGCVTTGVGGDKPEPPPKPTAACQVVVTWQNRVQFAADPTNGGAPTPGFAGRVYLFGPDLGFPVVATGTLVFDLYDETAGAPHLIERWNLDPETVKRLLKKDVIGWGYTVFLPSKEARPEMTKVRLRTAFQAAKAAPVYTENVVTLAETNGVIREGTAPFHLPRGPRAPAAGNQTLPPPTAMNQTPPAPTAR